jgi:hypothetical protein
VLFFAWESLEMLASRIEFRAQFAELLRGERDADVDGGGLLRVKGFIAVDVWQEFGGDEAVDIEFDAGSVSVFRGGSFSHVEAFLDKELGLFFASVIPEIGEPGVTLPPFFESFKMWKVGVIGEDLGDGTVGGSDEIADASGERFSERLALTFWVAGLWVRALTESLDGKGIGHLGQKP